MVGGNDGEELPCKPLNPQELKRLRDDVPGTNGPGDPGMFMFTAQEPGGGARC